MRTQTDGAILRSLWKAYGSTPRMTRNELRRRLRMIPELGYFADELVEEGLARGILRAVDDGLGQEPPAGGAGPEPRPVWVELVRESPTEPWSW